MNPCILVFGLPRSGTTWVGKLFDSHPDTLYRHEPDSVQALDLPAFPEREDMARHREEVLRFVQAMPKSRHPKVVGKQPLFAKSYQSATGLLAYRASITATKVMGRISTKAPCAFRPTARDAGQARLVWKSIESSGRLATCIEALPGARAIYLMRDPCACIASLLRGQNQHRFSQATPSMRSFWRSRKPLAQHAVREHGLDLEVIERLTPEEQLAWRWVLTQEKVLSDIAGCDRVLTMRHEDVCADPIGATRRMFAFTGLDWSAQTEAFIQSSTQAADSGYYGIFKDPQVAAQRWRRELAPDVVRRIRTILEQSYLQGFFSDVPEVEILHPDSSPEVAT